MARAVPRSTSHTSELIPSHPFEFPQWPFAGCCHTHAKFVLIPHEDIIIREFVKHVEFWCPRHAVQSFRLSQEQDQDIVEGCGSRLLQ